MYCAACGALNDDNAFRCTSCSKKLLRSGEVLTSVDEDPGIGPVAVPLAMAILSALFCCQPLGIVAVVFAALAMGRNSAGAYTEARGYSENARKWAKIAIGLGLVVQLIWIGMMIAGGFAGAMGKNP